MDTKDKAGDLGNQSEEVKLKKPRSDLLITNFSDIVLGALLSKLNLLPSEYKMTDDQLSRLACPLNTEDQIPVTPMSEFVPLAKVDSFSGSGLKV